jgi:hypothetical protein
MPKESPLTPDLTELIQQSKELKDVANRLIAQAKRLDETITQLNEAAREVEKKAGKRRASKR